MLSTDLENLNKHLDEIALEKRLQIEAEHLKRIKCIKTLRLYIMPSKTHINIYTRIINDLKNDENVELWDLIYRVCICFNSDLDPSGRTESFASCSEIRIEEWTKQSNVNSFSSKIAERDRRIQILIKSRNKREIYKVDKKIEDLLGKEYDTKQNIIKDFYKYINGKKLNCYTSGVVTCDETLKDIFKVEYFNFNDIESMIEKYLYPIGYSVINVNPAEKEIWDVEIETDDLSQKPVLFSKDVMEIEKKIESMKIILLKNTEKISNLEEYIDDPSLFANKRMALKTDITGVKSAFYDDLNVQTAVYELMRKHDK